MDGLDGMVRGYVDGWMECWMHGWVDIWMDKWMDRSRVVELYRLNGHTRNRTDYNRCRLNNWRRC